MKQTRLLEKEVLVSRRLSMQVTYLPEEEVLQTTTCSAKDVHADIDGWRKAFTKELDSFEGLNVKTEMWENTLDVSKKMISPGKDVMVKKPVGYGTHLKKGRVVVCAKLQTSTTWRGYVCKHTVISDVANAYFIGVIATLGSIVMGCVLYAQLPEEHTVYCRLPNVLVRLGLVKIGVVWKLNKALYCLKTSPKAWECVDHKRKDCCGFPEKAFGNGHMSMILLQFVSQSNLME